MIKLKYKDTVNMSLFCANQDRIIHHYFVDTMLKSKVVLTLSKGLRSSLLKHCLTGGFLF